MWGEKRRLQQKNLPIRSTSTILTYFLRGLLRVSLPAAHRPRQEECGLLQRGGQGGGGLGAAAAAALLGCSSCRGWFHAVAVVSQVPPCGGAAVSPCAAQQVADGAEDVGEDGLD